ncbi:oligosaccharide flippase family protein [Luminiphilus sp.]|nr:oligosaccharide flippase family protein [Luminiphilus sp.]
MYSPVAQVAVFKFLGFAINFLSILLIARYMEKDVAGQYFTWLNICLIGTIFLQIGIPQTLMRGIAQGKIKSRSINLYWKSANVFALLISTVLILIVILLKSNYFYHMAFLILAVFCCLNCNVIIFILRGKLDYKNAAFRESILRPSLILIFTALAVISGPVSSVLVLVGCYFFAVLVSLLFDSKFILQSFSSRHLLTPKDFIDRLRKTYKLGLNGGLNQLLVTIDVILVSLLMSHDMASELKLAVSFAGLASIASISKQYLAGPVLAKMAVDDNFLDIRKYLVREILKVVISMLLLWVLLTCLLYVSADILLGPNYEKLYQTFLILFLPYSMNSILGFLIMTLVAFRHEHRAIKVMILVCVTYVICAFMIIPAIGVFGVAFSFAVGCSLGIVVSLRSLTRIRRAMG